MVLIANALWRIGTAYVAFYKFKDSVRSGVDGKGQSEEELRQKILELASTYDVPLAEEDDRHPPRGSITPTSRVVQDAGGRVPGVSSTSGRSAWTSTPTRSPRRPGEAT